VIREPTGPQRDEDEDALFAAQAAFNARSRCATPLTCRSRTSVAGRSAHTY
jgi:hypothetical protein